MSLKVCKTSLQSITFQFHTFLDHRAGIFGDMEPMLIGLLRHICKFSGRLVSAYHTDIHNWIIVMNIVHLVSWIGKYYFGIQTVWGERSGMYRTPASMAICAYRKHQLRSP
jgi:hypothetical protein